MIQSIAVTLTLIITWLLTIPMSFCQTVSEPFEFQFEHKTLRGLIERPQNQRSEALAIIIPGYGRTDFVEGNWFSDLRSKLVASGLTVCFWDKMGCGNSEGEFNAQQPVENSADEAIAAIREIKRLKISGSEKIGLWGISRAGWICPLINEQFPIDFWISVSGTDDKENFGYLLKSNLIIAGKDEEEAEKLFQVWMLGHKLFCTGSDFENYSDAVQPLKQDSTCRRLFGYSMDPGISERIHLDDIYPENDADVVTSGGTGFGIMATIVGIERGFITRREGYQRLNKLVNWLQNANRFHGAWPHWMYPDGRVKPFSKYDNGGDLVETAFLVQGLIAARQYFKKGNDKERALSALSSFPYTPGESMKFLKYMYHEQDSLIGEYGPYDAFSLQSRWYLKRYLAIDQLPIPVMIENYRSGLIWDLFMSAPEIHSALDKLGFHYKKRTPY